MCGVVCGKTDCTDTLKVFRVRVLSVAKNSTKFLLVKKLGKPKSLANQKVWETKKVSKPTRLVNQKG